MCKFVDQCDARPAQQHSRGVHFLERAATVVQLAMADHVETFDLFDGVLAGVGLKVRNDDVHAVLYSRVRAREHLKGLTNTRRVTQINLQVATLSLLWHRHGAELMRKNANVDAFGGANEPKDRVTEESIAPVFVRAMSNENLCYTLLPSVLGDRRNRIVAFEHFGRGAGFTRSLEIGFDRGVFVLRSATSTHIDSVEFPLEALFVSPAAFDHGQRT